jgi:hypothetical protein
MKTYLSGRERKFFASRNEPLIETVICTSHIVFSGSLSFRPFDETCWRTIWKTFMTKPLRRTAIERKSRHMYLLPNLRYEMVNDMVKRGTVHHRIDSSDWGQLSMERAIHLLPAQSRTVHRNTPNIHKTNSTEPVFGNSQVSAMVIGHYSWGKENHFLFWYRYYW